MILEKEIEEVEDLKEDEDGIYIIRSKKDPSILLMHRDKCIKNCNGPAFFSSKRFAELYFEWMKTPSGTEISSIKFNDLMDLALEKKKMGYPIYALVNVDNIEKPQLYPLIKT